MKQFLLKVLEVVQRVLRAVIEITYRLVSLLRSVNIDTPRGVILCVALQLIIALSVLIAFRTQPVSHVQPLEGRSTPEDTVSPGQPRDASIPGSDR